ncbi:MAG TPA: hypothetical protein VIM14_13765 [Polyangia bacterium]
MTETAPSARLSGVTKQRCARCVLSAAFPNIKFDVEGVCNFCRDEVGVRGDDTAIERGRVRVMELFAEQKARKKTYDAVLCNSGGKDSSYTLKLAVEKYGLTVLSFTLDNGFVAPVARDNINRVVDALGVDHVTVRPALDVFKSVVRAASLLPIYGEQSLTRISAGCNACISLVNTIALRMALEKEIPFILAGFTLGQIPANGIVYRNHHRFLAESREASMSRLREAVGEGVDRLYEVPDSLIQRAPYYPHNINLLCLESITEAQILDEVGKLGWKRPSGLDGCSSNCMLNTFNNYVHDWRHGYSPYELELSHLVRKRLMTRNEALEKLADQPLEQLPSLVKSLALSPKDLATLGLLADGQVAG